MSQTSHESCILWDSKIFVMPVTTFSSHAPSSGADSCRLAISVCRISFNVLRIRFSSATDSKLFLPGNYSTDVGEAEEIESFWFTSFTLLSVAVCKPFKFDKLSLILSDLKRKFPKTNSKLCLKLNRFLSTLIPNDEIVCISDDDHIALSPMLSPGFNKTFSGFSGSKAFQLILDPGSHSAA